MSYYYDRTSIIKYSRFTINSWLVIIHRKNIFFLEFSAKEFTGSINKIAYDFEAKFRTISLQIEEFYLFKK